MSEDERAALPRRVPHANGPPIPHDPRSPREPLRRAQLGPAAIAALAQLRAARDAAGNKAAIDATGTPVGREAGPAAGQARPPHRGAFEPPRLAGKPLGPANGTPLPAGPPVHPAPGPARPAGELVLLAGELVPLADVLGLRAGQDEAGTTVAAAGPAGQAARVQPSWPAALATAARLRLARRVPAPSRRLRLACLVVLTLALASAVGLVAARQGLGVASADGKPGRAAAGGESQPASPSAAVRGLAAGWVAGQVGGNVTLACDPAMCAELAARGFPAANLVSIVPGATGLPSADLASGLPGADLVAATQSVRGYLGSRLARVYAPLVIASFGTGPAQIQIRQVAPYGAAAFQREFTNGQAALRRVGAQLLRNPRIAVSVTAKAALMAGRVDGRLLTVLAALASRQPVWVLSFAGGNPGAPPGVPLRQMLLAGSGPGWQIPAPTYARSLLSFVHAQPAPYHPAQCSLVRQPSGPGAISIGFAAPSPPGL